jgi:hypothetical protein
MSSSVAFTGADLGTLAGVEMTSLSVLAGEMPRFGVAEVEWIGVIIGVAVIV